MAQPTAYNKGKVYTGDSYNGADLDAEFSDIEVTVDEICANLELIQADDGGLQNGIVDFDALDAGVVAALGSGVVFEGTWTSGDQYTANESVVEQDGSTYVALTTHVAGADFDVDRGLGKWQRLGANIGQDATGVAFDSSGIASLSATTVQAAIAEVVADYIAADAVVAATVTAHTGDSSAAHAASAISVTPTGGIAATDVQAALAELDSEKAGLGANTFTDTQTITSSDAGSSIGPTLLLDRVSASPATNDIIGGVVMRGRDAGGAVADYAQIQAEIEDTTNASEDGRIALATIRAGSLAKRFLVGSGLYANGQTDPGAGGINVTAVKIAGVNGAPVDYICIRDQKASTTEGGGFTSGAWQTRTLNTEVSDTGGHASISSNQITLAAGTYECRISCPALLCADHQARLYNITDTATVLVGTCEQAPTGSTASSRSIIAGRFTLASSKALEVQHRCSTTRATDGFGGATGFGEVEVYTVAEFWKVG